MQFGDGVAHAGHRLDKLLGPDLLVGARLDEVLLDGDQLGLHPLNHDIQLGGFTIELIEGRVGSFLAVAQSARRERQSLQLFFGRGTLDGDLFKARLVLVAKHGGGQGAHGEAVRH